MDGPVPSKRPRLSIDVKPKVSWTQDEWTELLTDECSIKKERAHQIASKLAEQDFNTGRFSSFISEWQNNWEGCKGILLGIGFQEMEIVSFVALLRRHTEKATTEKQTTIAVVANRKKRPMCNELVWAVCKGIGVVNTSDRILLTSANIYAYLEKPFRKKLVYWDAFSFLKANIWSKFEIAIDQLDQNIEDGIVVAETNSGYEVRISNHLRIKFTPRISLGNIGLISVHENALENVHGHFFLHLIAPQLRPIAFNLANYDNCAPSSAVCFLNKMHDSIDWVHLRLTQFSSEPINVVLQKCNKLEMSSSNSLDEDQIRQFCDSFIRWINANNGGQPKMCAIYVWKQNEILILRLLDAVNKDFVGATDKRQFAMRFFVRATAAEQPLAELTVRNVRTQEQLQLRRINNGCYMLIRQTVTELDTYNYVQLLERELDKINEMTTINRM